MIYDTVRLLGLGRDRGVAGQGGKGLAYMKIGSMRTRVSLVAAVAAAAVISGLLTAAPAGATTPAMPPTTASPTAPTPVPRAGAGTGRPSPSAPTSTTSKPPPAPAPTNRPAIPPATLKRLVAQESVASAPPKMAPKPAASVRPNVTTNAAANDPNCDFYPQTGHAVCGAIRDDYNNTLGGPNGPLGYPTSDELTSPDGVGKFNTFQNAGDHIYWSPATGAAEIGGAIFDHWGTFGYELGPLGYPTSGELPLGGGAQANTFQGGPVITWSPSTGACEIGGEIYLHWAHFSFNLGPLGLPTSDEITNPDGAGKRNTFQYGGDHIYWSPATGAQEIGGAIFQHWGDYGYETGPLGYPISDEITNPDGVGKRNNFQNAGDHIYWSPASGAHEIGGAIFDHWGALGYEGGPLGYPTTDEFASSSIAGARLNGFQGGSIYWSPGTGASSVRGAIFGQWAELSFEAGPLGLPTSDEYPSGGRILQNFQRGQLEWSPSMSDGSTSSYSYGGTSADAAAFWTPQRMASAVSLDPPGNDFPSPANQASGASGASVRAAGPVRTVPPIEAATPQPGVSSAAVTGLSPAAGKLFFTIVGTDSVERPFVCSASTINTPSKSIIATAAHCAFSPHAGDWHQNIMFAPGYINGALPGSA